MRGSGCEAIEWGRAGVRPGVKNALRFKITSQSPGRPPCLLSLEPRLPALCPALPCPLRTFGSGGWEVGAGGGSFKLILGSSNAASLSVPRPGLEPCRRDSLHADSRPALVRSVFPVTSGPAL